MIAGEGIGLLILRIAFGQSNPPDFEMIPGHVIVHCADGGLNPERQGDAELMVFRKVV